MEDTQRLDAMLPTASHAWAAWKGWAIAKGHMWRRFLEDTFDSMPFGKLWNEWRRKIAPVEASCGGEDCDWPAANACCDSCTTVSDEPCYDDPQWEADNGKGCDWVDKKPEDRCDGEAKDACMCTCEDYRF